MGSAGHTAEAGGRAEVDDASPSILQVGKRRLIGVQCAAHVDVEDQVPVRLAYGFGRCRTLHRSDVGQYIESAQPAHCFTEGTIHLGLVSDVAMEEQDLAWMAGLQFVDQSHALLVQYVQGNHTRAFRYVGTHHAGAYTAGATGDDRVPACQLHGIDLLFLLYGELIALVDGRQPTFLMASRHPP
ncbi:hypothetical protein D9M68_343000 [compost metagenome]